MRSLRLHFIVLVFVCVAAIKPAHAEPVQVRAATNAEGARIVLLWQTPVAYQAELSDNILRLNFNRSIEADLSTITGNIPGFVIGTERSPDGLQVNLLLSQPFGLIHYPINRSVIIDLVGVPGVAQSTAAEQSEASAEQTSAVPPQNADEQTEPGGSDVADQAVETPAPSVVDVTTLPQVGIRTGLHADKVRVVFDWEQQVPYTVTRNGGIVSVSFGQPAALDADGLSGVAPNVLGGARYRNTADTATVDMAVAPGATVQDFYAGTKVVMDILFPTDGSTPGVLPALAQEETVASSAEEPEVDTGIVEDTAETEEVLSDSVAVTSQEPASEITPLDNPLDTPPDTSSESPESNGLAQPTELTVVEEQTTSSGETATAAAPGAPQGVVESGATASADGFSLRFDWDEPVATAVFRRGSALWIVFDRLAQIDVDAMRATAGDQLIELIQLQHPAATVLRAITGQGINPVPKREGLAWVFDFAEQGLSTLSPVEAVVQPDSPVGARVFLPVPEPGRVTALVDPEMGDNFVTVPVTPLGYGVTNFYHYPQFRIRPSSQGIVVEPRVDNLRIRSSRQGVGITSTRTLQISPIGDTDRTRADRGLSRVIDWEPVQNVTTESFNERRQELERGIALASSQSDRAEGRFELVRFFLAHAYAAEALGVLRVLADEIPDAEKRTDYRVYRGIANYLMGRLDEARADFEGGQLDNNDEGLFWRALVEFETGNEAPEVMRELRSTGGIPDPYPRALRIPLAMKVIEAIIRIGDSDRAQELLENLGAEDLSPEERGEWLYLSGLNSESAGDYEVAIINFEQAEAGAHLPSRILATRARVELELELERITILDAIDQLEPLRFAWRGGRFEFELLRRLGDLYLSQGGYRQGLTTLRQAVTHYREMEEAEQITKRMSDTFAFLFLKDGADRLPPITAIALYEEFKELTPLGELGDEMIQKLADRLVRVDLLDEASDLLDGQVKFRLQGVEKARVGAQLAIVRLLARDYDGALKALDISDEGDQPESLRQQRRHLRARARIGLGDGTGALELLVNDETYGAEQLRAEQYWLEDWPRAAQSLRRLIRLDDIERNAPLEPAQASRILNYAIALQQSGNDRALDRVRENYGAAMAATDLKDAFALIATPDQFGLISADVIPSKIRLAENFQTFMTAYEQRLEEENLSEIN